MAHRDAWRSSSESPVAAACCCVAWQASVRDLRSMVGQIAGSACERGAGLVVMPGLLGWSLVGPALGLSPGAQFDWSTLARLSRSSDSLIGACRDAGRGALHVHQDVARAFGVWMVSAPYPLADESGALRQASAVIDSEGTIAGEQQQCHRSPTDMLLGMAQSTILAPIDTPWGKLGLLLGEDVMRPEVGRLLALMGATLLVHQGDGMAAGLHERLAGLWRECQSNFAYGIEAQVYREYGASRSAIIAPLELSDGDGLVAESKHADGELACAQLDAAALQSMREQEGFPHTLNIDVISRELPWLYQESAAW